MPRDRYLYRFPYHLPRPTGFVPSRYSGWRNVDYSTSYGLFAQDDFGDFSSRTVANKAVSQPNGFATTGGVAGECEVIQELVTAATSSAMPEDQNDVAKTWLRPQYLRSARPPGAVRPLLCQPADWRRDCELLGVGANGGRRPPERDAPQVFHSVAGPRKARSYICFCY